jgi:hypothetical protein
MNRTRASVLLALGLGLLSLPAAARACNVPVFRFALERWPADPYEVIVFHRGPLAEADRSAVDQLKQVEGEGTSRCNLRLHLVDLAQDPHPGLLRLLPKSGPPELPWVIVRYPEAVEIDLTVWAGRLRQDTAQVLGESPARLELARRILAGESGVWLFLESGHRERDNAALALLETELAKLPERVKLPELTDAPEDQVSSKGPPLRIAFSLLRVRRDDPAEDVLVKMLLGSEPDLAERNEPLVFPTFGRGRVLYALVGAGITADNIREAGAFLVGACSCEVKRQNPGTDLLMAVDWDAQIGTRIAEEAPFRVNSGQTVAIAPGDNLTATHAEQAVVVPNVSKVPAPRYLLLAGAAAAGMLVIVTGIIALRTRRPR